MLMKAPVEIRLEIERDKEIIEQASPEIRKIHKNLDGALILSVLFNSPMTLLISLAAFPFVIVCILFCLLIRRTKNIIDEWNEKMWGNVYSTRYA
jgi:hypothetical protein